MSNLPTFRAQQWVYSHDAYELIVENAWTWTGLSQERVRLDGQVIYSNLAMSVPIFWTTAVRHAWPPGGEITVQWKSGLLTLKCRALINDKPVRWTKTFAARWQGEHGHWPD